MKEISIESFKRKIDDTLCRCIYNPIFIPVSIDVVAKISINIFNDPHMIVHIGSSYILINQIKNILFSNDKKGNELYIIHIGDYQQCKSKLLLKKYTK